MTDHLYLRTMNIDGSNYRTLLTYYYNFGLDYDYRYLFCKANGESNIILVILNVLCN